jgi:preprotein translocase subunit SecG
MNPFSQFRDDLVKGILNIQDAFYSNAITALTYIALILFFIYIIKIIIQNKKERKEREKRWIRFEREWISLFNKEEIDK